MVALALGGVNLGVLIGSLGLATVALGFALQDIVSNFTAGIVLLLEHPFTEGDHIAIAEAEGEVEEIRSGDPAARPDGQLVIVPNKLLFTQVVTNSTATMRRRVEVPLEVPYGQDARARSWCWPRRPGSRGSAPTPPPPAHPGPGATPAACASRSGSTPAATTRPGPQRTAGRGGAALGGLGGRTPPNGTASGEVRA